MDYLVKTDQIGVVLSRRHADAIYHGLLLCSKAANGMIQVNTVCIEIMAVNDGAIWH